MKVLKGVVLLLALANAAYFLYAHGVAPPPASPQPEGSATSLKLVTTRAASAATEPGTHATAARCASVGPFAELAESAHAQATLRGGGYVPRQRATEAEVPDGVLLYLPQPATPAAAAQLRRKLKGAGIPDAPDVPGPNDSTVLSLGMFSDPQRAQSRLAVLRKAGFAPQSLEHRHSGTVYWLDVDLKPDDAPLNAADLHGDSGHALPLEVRECPAPPAAGAPPVPGAQAPGASAAGDPGIAASAAQ